MRHGRALQRLSYRTAALSAGNSCGIRVGRRVDALAHSDVFWTDPGVSVGGAFAFPHNTRPVVSAGFTMWGLHALPTPPPKLLWPPPHVARRFDASADASKSSPRAHRRHRVFLVARREVQGCQRIDLAFPDI